MRRERGGEEDGNFYVSRCGFSSHPFLVPEPICLASLTFIVALLVPGALMPVQEVEQGLLNRLRINKCVAKPRNRQIVSSRGQGDPLYRQIVSFFSGVAPFFSAVGVILFGVEPFYIEGGVIFSGVEPFCIEGGVFFTGIAPFYTEGGVIFSGVELFCIGEGAFSFDAEPFFPETVFFSFIDSRQ